jgi:drug/metabolite transporter (DMT)-like permease
MDGLSTLFVLIWSTGFLVGRAIVPVASPCLFLAARFLLAAGLFAAMALVAGVRWPSRRELPRHLLVGMLLNGLYLCAGYWAVSQGLSPAIMALLGALQPLFTALLAIPLLSEYPGKRFWQGLALGLFGVVLVLLPALHANGAGSITPPVLGAGIVAVLSLTVGTVLQKTSIAAVDLRASSALQNIGAALFAALAACGLGERRWVAGPELFGALAWASVVLSGVGTGLLLLLLRRGQVARVAALMYLAPPLAALQAYLLFDARLTLLQLAGFALALGGVLLCRQKGSPGHAGQTVKAYR